MVIRAELLLVAAVAWAFAAPVQASELPKPQCPAVDEIDPSSSSATVAKMVSADDIPVAHTPPGGYRDEFPDPVLAPCTEPIIEGAPDLRGLWRTLRAEQVEASTSRTLSILRFLFWNAFGVERDREPVPAGDRIYAYVERIEQCGDRIVAIGGGTIADARADGSEENAVHDVSAFDFESPITAIASYENGVFVLRPPTLPIAITRRLDADGNLVWHRPDLGDRIVTLERIGSACDRPPGTDWVRSAPVP